MEYWLVILIDIVDVAAILFELTWLWLWLQACERFQRLGAEFHKSPNGGGMKGLAFVKVCPPHSAQCSAACICMPIIALLCIYACLRDMLSWWQDPDGYLIEVLPQGEMITKELDCCGIRADSGDQYKDNSK